MAKIVVLGSEGMLGRDLLVTLSHAHEVIGFDKNDIDITRQRATAELLRDIAPDCVVNAAGYTDVDRCEKMVRKAFSVNGEGVKNVAKACRYVSAKLVHISTDYVFDGEKGSPYHEEDPPNPINIYGESKLMGERYVERYLDDYLIIRTQWLYGKQGPNFVETILALAEKTVRIEVVNDQTGSPTYTSDLSRGICHLVERGVRGIFHVTNQGACSWYEFALEIIRLSDGVRAEIVPVTSKALNRPAERPSFSVLDCGKFGRVTGMAMRSWRDGLRDYFRR